jgi:hypothetical protein
MALAFKKAEKHQAKLRLAIFGPSGSGKTMTALRVATGMGGPIAFIDSERGSASKYGDRFAFDVLNLDNKTIEGGYVPAMSAAAQAKYPVLIVDSISHGWQELLEEVDLIAKTKYRGNTWSAWSEGTPKQRKMIEAILNYPGHVICTMRSDTAWEQEKTKDGKVKPVKVGLKPQGGKGIEYEFDMLMEITVEHYATVTKDRTSKFQDKIIDKPDEAFGKSLIDWLNSGSVAPRPAVPLAVHNPEPNPSEPAEAKPNWPHPAESAAPAAPAKIEVEPDPSKTKEATITAADWAAVETLRKNVQMTADAVSFHLKEMGYARGSDLPQSRLFELRQWIKGA